MQLDPQGADADPMLRQPRLLIVDDDEGTLQVFAKVLALEGYEVRATLHPHLALVEVGVFEPDAIILDLRMPFMNGVGFLYRLRAQQRLCRTVPVAIITGDPSIDEPTLAELKALGAVVRYKPIWVEDLVKLARTLLFANTSEPANIPTLIS